MSGFVYILECADDTYYTGSTKNLVLRLYQHSIGVGSNYTAKRLPVKLVYFKQFNRVSEAFYREKQIQGWSRRKKQALINNTENNLKWFSVCYSDFLQCLKNGCNNYRNLNLSNLSLLKNLDYDEIKISELLEYLASFDNS